MEIPIDEAWLKTLYDILIRVYSNTERPIVSGFPIVTDYDEGLLGACVERGNTSLLGKAVFPHILQKASVLMHSIINFHPFVDGNKRVALLAVNFYLHWNGYKLKIPFDADEFTIDVAKGKLNLGDILFWLRRNSVRTPLTVVQHWLCEAEMSEYHQSKPLQGLPFLFPREAVRFFRMKILEERLKRMKKTQNGFKS
jgi:death-on-curing protein